MIRKPLCSHVSAGENSFCITFVRLKELTCECQQSILVLRNEWYSMRKIAKKLKISYNDVYYFLQRTRVEREVGGPVAQLSEKISTLESLV